jgi:hypothetical protein
MSFWKSLLTDKSFWAAIIALATSAFVSLNVSQGSIAQITALISAIGVFVAYIISDGIKQAAAIKANAQTEVARAAIETKKQ